MCRVTMREGRATRIRDARKELSRAVGTLRRRGRRMSRRCTQAETLEAAEVFFVSYLGTVKQIRERYLKVLRETLP